MSYTVSEYKFGNFGYYWKALPDGDNHFENGTSATASQSAKKLAEDLREHFPGCRLLKMVWDEGREGYIVSLSADIQIVLGYYGDNHTVSRAKELSEEEYRRKIPLDFQAALEEALS